MRERVWRVRTARMAVLGLAVAACLTAYVVGRPNPEGSAAGAVPPDAVTAGSIAVYDGYVREPASPVNAAAYFTVTNTGTEPDELVAVSSPAAPTVSLHDLPGAAHAAGHGAGEHQPAGPLAVAPGATVTLAPGNGHVMLEQPTAALAPGDEVELTLTFAVAGELTLTVPVIAIGAEPPGGRQ